jgi:hypothetical protein
MNTQEPNGDGFLFGTRSVPIEQSSPEVISQPSMLEQFSNKNFLIMLLTALLVFSFMGVNILSLFGNLIQNIMNFLKPLIVYILSIFGYTAGTILSTTADVVGDTVITGVDIAQDSVKSAGELLKNASKTSAPVLDIAINNSGYVVNEPEPARTSNPVVSPSTNKQSWCLVGEHMEKRGCIQIDEYDKCMSGQVYPSQKMCLNPTMSP